MPVLEEHRPTLAELVAPRLARAPRWVPWALAALALLVAAAVTWRVLQRPERVTVRGAALTVSLTRPAGLARVAPQPGELVRFERRRHGRLVASVAVAPLVLAPYRGLVSGALPLRADAEIAALGRRFAGFRLFREGKDRLGDLPVYAVLFAARLGGRPVFGRLVLAPAPAGADPASNARARRGVRILILATRTAGAREPDDVGARGPLRATLRSVRVHPARGA